jgi:hypothetical protein
MLMRVRFVSSTIALIAAVGILPVTAQEKPSPTPPPAEKAAAAPRRLPPPVPLKVTVLLSRFQGEKRVSSMPYVVGVMASGWGAGPKTTLRMGVDVPVSQTIFGGDSKASPISSYNYRNVGTNIDCSATFDEAVPGVFQLALTVSDSSLGLDSAKRVGGGSAGVVADVPSFRSFNSSFTALLRDGQTMQYTSATDPVTGELMKIDVTVALMK